MIKIVLVMSMICIAVWAEEAYKSYHVKENGKKIEIKTKKSSEKSKEIQVTEDGKKFSKDTKLVVKFNKKIDIEEFCKKYELEVIHKMVTGHYILKNNSGILPMELIKQIIEKEVSVLTIFPNWQLNQKMQ